MANNASLTKGSNIEFSYESELMGVQIILIGYVCLHEVDCQLSSTLAPPLSV